MLAEFSIVLPLLILLLVGIIDFGYYLHDYISTQVALREGGRAAMQALGDDDGTPVYTDDQLKQIISRAHGPVNRIKWKAGASSITDENEIVITVKPADPQFDSRYGSVTILVDHRHDFLVPIFLFAKDGLRIKGQLKVARVPGLAP